MRRLFGRHREMKNDLRRWIHRESQWVIALAAGRRYDSPHPAGE
jgi:hypothetical protein